jgi:hypothetical protein
MGNNFVLPENNNLLNRAAHKWLREAREHAPPDNLHLLTLAFWGLENGVRGEWPERDRPALEEQVGLLLGWDPHNALKWLLSNPNGGPRAILDFALRCRKRVICNMQQASIGRRTHQIGIPGPEPNWHLASSRGLHQCGSSRRRSRHPAIAGGYRPVAIDPDRD